MYPTFEEFVRQGKCIIRLFLVTGNDLIRPNVLGHELACSCLWEVEVLTQRGGNGTVTQKTVPMFATFDFLPLYLHN